MQKLELWNNSPQQKEKPIIKPTRLKNLINSSDMQHIIKRNFFWIGVSVNGQSYFATLDSMVPQQQTTLNRDRHNQVVGFPLVVGG